MKNHIQPTILQSFVIFMIVLSACAKKTYTPQYQDAIITGMDYRKCACCGGLMITFSSDPVPYSADFKLISNRNSELGISDTDTFPIFVKTIWETDSTRCGQFVKIKKIYRK